MSEVSSAAPRHEDSEAQEKPGKIFDRLRILIPEPGVVSQEFLESAHLLNTSLKGVDVIKSLVEEAFQKSATIDREHFTSDHIEWLQYLSTITPDMVNAREAVLQSAIGDKEKRDGFQAEINSLYEKVTDETDSTVMVDPFSSETEVKVSEEEAIDKLNGFRALIIGSDHDLRTPLTSVNAYPQLMNRRLGINSDIGADPKFIKQVNAILDNLDKMAQLMRLADEAIEGRYPKEVMNIEQFHQYVEEHFASLKKTWQEAGVPDPINLRAFPPVYAEEDMPTFVWSKSEIDAFLDNLITNAIEAGAKKFTMLYMETQNGPQMMSKDDGPGVPAVVENSGKYPQGFSTKGKDGHGIGMSESITRAKMFFGINIIPRNGHDQQGGVTGAMHIITPPSKITKKEGESS